MSNGKAYEGMPSDHINDFHTHKLFTEARYNVTTCYLCWGVSIATLTSVGEEALQVFSYTGKLESGLALHLVSCAWEKALL